MKAIKQMSHNESELNITVDDALLPFIGDEVFLLSCQVTTYNKFGWRNIRTIVLTQESFLIFRNQFKEFRRKLNVASLRGVTLSLNEDSFEMVIHV